MRIHAYWNFLAGACGYTYGNNAVWQMFKNGDELIVPVIADWHESLNHKGANQIIHLKKLIESYSIAKLLPDQSIVYGANPKNNQHIRSAKSVGGEWVIVYLAKGQKVSIVMTKLHGSTVLAYWYNPKNGNRIFIGEFSNKGILEFVPPTNGKDNDWLLVIDDKK